MPKSGGFIAPPTAPTPERDPGSPRRPVQPTLGRRCPRAGCFRRDRPDPGLRRSPATSPAVGWGDPPWSRPSSAMSGRSSPAPNAAPSSSSPAEDPNAPAPRGQGSAYRIGDGNKSPAISIIEFTESRPGSRPPSRLPVPSEKTSPCAASRLLKSRHGDPNQTPGQLMKPTSSSPRRFRLTRSAPGFHRLGATTMPDAKPATTRPGSVRARRQPMHVATLSFSRLTRRSRFASVMAFGCSI